MPVSSSPPLKRRLALGSLTFLVLAAGLFALYTWGVLNWAYSSGERAGYVQKFSHKGWVCKTWEGELAMVAMPGTLAEKFPFTVHDEAVAARINASLGKRVALVYEQHVGLPNSCFGETPYFITGVRLVE
ncbi:MAG: hypothetical protein PHU46_15350 [Rhodocyclaceae bacterium]|nr:hypothetical protein [Rhodocyclaceae bacterium]